MKYKTRDSRWARYGEAAKCDLDKHGSWNFDSRRQPPRLEGGRGHIGRWSRRHASRRTLLPPSRSCRALHSTMMSTLGESCFQSSAMRRTKSLSKASRGLTPCPWNLWWESQSPPAVAVAQGQPSVPSCCQSRSTHIGDAAGSVFVISSTTLRSCVREQLLSLRARLNRLRAVDGLPPSGMDMGGHRSDPQRDGGQGRPTQPGVDLVSRGRTPGESVDVQPVLRLEDMQGVRTQAA